MKPHLVSLIEAGEPELKGKFCDDFKAVAKLGPQRLTELADVLKNLYRVNTDREAVKLLEAEASRVDVDSDVFFRVGRLGLYLLKHFKQGEVGQTDDPTAIGGAFRTLKWIDDASEKPVVVFLTMVKGLATGGLNEEISKTESLRKGARRLTRVIPSIDFRALFSSSVDFGENLTDRKPSCVGVTPVVTLKICHSFDEPDYIVQCDPETLESTIQALKYAQLELSEAKKLLKLEPTK